MHLKVIVPDGLKERTDVFLQKKKQWHNRSTFISQAIIEKLEREGG